MTETKLFPPWRQAHQDLLAAGLQDGAVIPMDWLRERFGIAEAETIPEYERNRILFNSQMGELRAALLEERRVDLRLVPGVGYMVVPPEKQTELALKDRGAEIVNAMHRLGRQLTYVRTEGLTDEQRKANTDAQARIGALAALFSRRLEKLK